MRVSSVSSRLVPILGGVVIGLVLSVGLRLTFRPYRCASLTNYDESHASSAGISETSWLKQKLSWDLHADTGVTSNPGSDEAVGGTKGDTLQTTELRHRKLLFVGVMTAQKYLDNRVLGVFETWAQDVPGKVVFFTGQNDSLPDPADSLGRNVNRKFELVTLPGVDDSYPPQKKSFTMLRYMHENYGDEFEWFLRADDDVYVKADKLEALLRSINSRHLYFIGQAGKGNRAEKGSLNLAHNENFCMGGPGIILSHVALAKVAPYIDDCLKELYSTHEDVEVGRCVQKFAGISCTWAYEMQYVFYHNQSGDDAFTDSLKSREVHRAITLHPIKQYQHMYRLHGYIMALKIQDLLYDIIGFERKLVLLFSYRNGTSDSLTQRDMNRTRPARTDASFQCTHIYGLQPSLQKYRPLNQHELIPWDFIGKGIYSLHHLNPKQKADGSLKEGLEDVIRELMDNINGYSRSRGRIIEFKELLYGYHRVNPLYGEDIILDLLLTYKKYRGKKMTISVRRHAYVQRTFSPIQLRLVPSPSYLVGDPATASINSSLKTVRKKLILILPLSGRLEALDRFLGFYNEACASWTHKFALHLLIVYYDSTDGFDGRTRFFSLINNFREKTKVQKSCNVKVIQSDGEFARGVALEAGISQCSENDLMFLIDVDIKFSSSALERVIENTIQKQQIYFPIVFSQYSPDLLEKVSDYGSLPFDEPEISDNRGYWREFGYGISAFYRSDFRRAGGFDKTIKGWGKEDVSLFERFIAVTNLTIFRAPDPDLVHIYHPVVCDQNLSPSQFKMCQGTRSSSLGSERTLLKYILSQRPNILKHVIKM